MFSGCLRGFPNWLAIDLKFRLFTVLLGDKQHTVLCVHGPDALLRPLINWRHLVGFHGSQKVIDCFSFWCDKFLITMPSGL